MSEEATVEGPPRRRASWSLKTIVEDVAGRPIGEFQDPTRPLHPYLRGKIDGLPPMPSPVPLVEEPPYDPVAHLYPPLVGPTGRAFHGPEHEHDRETLARHSPPANGGNGTGHPPGPGHRPERLYLHYLLLHVDRLSDVALRYLHHAVEEEIQHRERTPLVSPPSASSSSQSPPAS